jgi:hypothetical protein
LQRFGNYLWLIIISSSSSSSSSYLGLVSPTLFYFLKIILVIYQRMERSKPSKKKKKKNFIILSTIIFKMIRGRGGGRRTDYIRQALKAEQAILRFQTSSSWFPSESHAWIQQGASSQRHRQN